MTNERCFSVKALGNGITVIRDYSTVQFYLVEGTERAALIDNGVGIGDLRALLGGITSLPVLALNTHAHADHAGGNLNFDEVWLSPRDQELLENAVSLKSRMGFVRSFLPRMGIEPEAGESDFTGTLKPVYHWLADYEEIDLGGRTLTAIPVPGHSPGSLGFLDSQAGAFFAGDCGNQSTYLFLKNSTPLALYRESLVSLMDYYDRIHSYYICHEFDVFPKSCIKDLIECCDLALTGKDAAIPYAIGGNPNALMSCPVDERGHRIDGRAGNLIYDKTKLR
jgi:glyoxylase-like metal-dependent hydrolase (beta-lactamase superfamily II)